MKYTYRSNERSGSGRTSGPRKYGARGAGERPSRGFRGGDDRFEKPRLFEATCAGCGKTCQVPFKPNGSKPVYCRDCFKKDGTMSAPSRFAKSSFGGPRSADTLERPRPFSAPAPSADLGKLEARLSAIEKKLDLLIESVTVEEEEGEEDEA
jgi:CxxC-x17-CxxC domain-containing protein